MLFDSPQVRIVLSVIVLLPSASLARMIPFAHLGCSDIGLPTDHAVLNRILHNLEAHELITRRRDGACVSTAFGRDCLKNYRAHLATMRC